MMCAVMVRDCQHAYLGHLKTAALAAEISAPKSGKTITDVEPLSDVIITVILGVATWWMVVKCISTC